MKKLKSRFSKSVIAPHKKFITTTVQIEFDRIRGEYIASVLGW